MCIRPLQRQVPQIHIYPFRPQRPHLPIPILFPPIPLPHEPRHLPLPNLVMCLKEIPVPTRALLLEVGSIDQRFEPRDDVLLGGVRGRGIGVGKGLCAASRVTWGG